MQLTSATPNVNYIIAFNPDSLNADRPPVIRSYALSVDAFDFFKGYQRRLEAVLGLRLTNGQVLERLLGDFAAHEAAADENALATLKERHAYVNSEMNRCNATLARRTR